MERGQDIFDIVFQKGASSENRHLLSKILDVVRGVDSPLLMIWTGTCDFTKLDRRTRYLSLDEDVSVADVDKLQNIKREVLKVNASTEVFFYNALYFPFDYGMNTKNIVNQILLKMMMMLYLVRLEI